MQENQCDPLNPKLEKENDACPNDAGEYVFRFPLKPKTNESHPDDTLRLFFRDQIRDLLKIVCFSKDGEKLYPNEFKLLNDHSKVYPIFEDDR